MHCERKGSNFICQFSWHYFKDAFFSPMNIFRIFVKLRVNCSCMDLYILVLNSIPFVYFCAIIVFFLLMLLYYNLQPCVVLPSAALFLLRIVLIISGCASLYISGPLSRVVIFHNILLIHEYGGLFLPLEI